MPEEKFEGKIEAPHLEGGIKASTKSDLAWSLEHSTCHIAFTHVTNKDETPFTFFICARHNATHLVKGIHEKIPC